MGFFFLQIFNFINLTYDTNSPIPTIAIARISSINSCTMLHKKKIKRGLLRCCNHECPSMTTYWKQKNICMHFMRLCIHCILPCTKWESKLHYIQYECTFQEHNFVSYLIESDYGNVVSSPLMQLCCKRTGIEILLEAGCGDGEMQKNHLELCHLVSC